MTAYKYKESGVEWLGKIPEHWKVDRLKFSLSKINSGVTPKGGATAYVNEGIPLIRSQNVKFNALDLSDIVYILEKTHEKMANSQVKNGDVLLNITGASLGRSCYVLNISEANVNQHVCILRPFLLIDGKFLNYLLISEVGQAQIFSGFKGSGREGLNFESIKNFKIPLPSKKEQEAIVAYLDEATAKIDETIRLKKEQIDLNLKHQEELILDVVTRGLNKSVELIESGFEWIGKVPKHWRVKKLKRVLDEVDYGISESTDREGNYAVLKMGNIQNREITDSKIEYVETVDEKLLVKDKDILFNRTNSLDQVAKVGIYRETLGKNVTYASYLVRLRPKKHLILPEFLNYTLNNKAFLKFARSMAIPSVQQANLNPNRYGRLEIAVPPIEEQKEIIEFLNTKLSALAKTGEVLTKQIETLKDYRKSLIHECVTGKKQVYQG